MVFVIVVLMFDFIIIGIVFCIGIVIKYIEIFILKLVMKYMW